MKLKSLLLFLCVGANDLGPTLIGAPNPDPSRSPVGRFHFGDVSAEAGLDRVVLAGRPDKDHLLDSAGTGAAWFDYDRDGYIDAYIVNSWQISGDEVTQKGKNALYRNRGNGTFEDVTDKAGVGGEGHWGSGVSVADVDQDGWPDLLVTNFGPTVLYRNRGDGTFENIAAAVGIENPGWNTGAVFLDAEGDGDLDLFVAGYIDTDWGKVLSAKPSLDWKGVAKVAMGPFGLPGAPDHFFLNNGKGRFIESTRTAGLVDHALGFGFAVRAADFDNDGDLDIYVANDSDANYLYRNEGNGTFKEVGLWAGCALDADGSAQAGMGVSTGDVNGDGILDIVVTNFSEDYTTLYGGVGDGFFEDLSNDAGVGTPMFNFLSWGTALVDLDNDTDLDLVISNGHIYPQIDKYPEIGFTYKQTNSLLENDGTGRFTDVSMESGPGFFLKESSRAMAAGDYDNDGDLDLLITNLDAAPTLLKNESQVGSWLSVICEISPGQGPLIGTQVRIRAGEVELYRDIASSCSYVSSHDPRVHFGLGNAKIVDRIEVRWPDGSTSVREQVAANQFLTIRKESARASR